MDIYSGDVTQISPAFGIIQIQKNTVGPIMNS